MCSGLMRRPRVRRSLLVVGAAAGQVQVVLGQAHAGGHALGLRVWGALPGDSGLGALGDVGVLGSLPTGSGKYPSVPHLGRDGQFGKPAPGIPTLDDEVSFVRRPDAAGLDPAYSGLGAQA